MPCAIGLPHSSFFTHQIKGDWRSQAHLNQLLLSDPEPLNPLTPTRMPFRLQMRWTAKYTHGVAQPRKKSYLQGKRRNRLSASQDHVDCAD